MNDFQEWLKTTPEYQTLVFQHGERLFIQRDGEFENLTVRLAYRVWGKQQAIIDNLKTQLNNMEACYIEKKKQVEAVDAVLMNWRDEYTEFAHQHECTVDAVLRTCIAELEQALRGDGD